jgi:DeoR family fructose operon transcriptional repressor
MNECEWKWMVQGQGSGFALHYAAKNKESEGSDTVMLTEGRHRIILEVLSKKGSVTVAELMAGLDSSESTIRRDLNTLAKEGRLKKVHGGAMAMEQSGYTFKDDDIAIRMKRAVPEKLRIGKYAASLIEDGDFVFIDAGTTTLMMLEYIESRDASFVTNAIEHARMLTKKGFNAYLVGGELKPTTEAIVGEEAVESLRKYNFTKAFLGTNGISVKNGFTTPELKEAMIKRQGMLSARDVYVLADATKFGEIAPVTFGRLQDAVILTDRVPQEQYKKGNRIVEVEEV